MSTDETRLLLQDCEFKDLCRRKNAVSAVLTVFIMLLYFGFIALVAFGRGLLAAKLANGITVGIPIGVGVILISWVLTGIYVLWANTRHDSRIERIKDRMGG